VVIEMSHGQAPSVHPSQCMQRMQQDHRVDTSRHGDQDALATFAGTPLTDGLFYTLDEMNHTRSLACPGKLEQRLNQQLNRPDAFPGAKPGICRSVAPEGDSGG